MAVLPLLRQPQPVRQPLCQRPAVCWPGARQANICAAHHGSDPFDAVVTCDWLPAVTRRPAQKDHAA